MKLIKKISQTRRDFWADYECENCGYKLLHESGYDDRNFYDNVIPEMKCKACGKSSKDLGTKIDHIETRYKEGVII